LSYNLGSPTDQKWKVRLISTRLIQLKTVIPFLSMKPRIIVCGLGRTGYTIYSLLRQQGATVIGISTEPRAGEQANIVVGDLRSASTLMKSGIVEAHTLVIASNDDAENLPF